MRKAIAVYLIVSALYAFTDIGMNASSATAGAFLLATFAGGVGLFMKKPWGHWAAVTVLAFQLVKIQVAGFAFSFLSLIGIYIFVLPLIAYLFTARSPHPRESRIELQVSRRP